MGYWVGSDFLRADVETRTKGTVRIRVWSAGNDDVATRAEVQIRIRIRVLMLTWGHAF